MLHQFLPLCLCPRLSYSLPLYFHHNLKGLSSTNVQTMARQRICRIVEHDRLACPAGGSTRPPHASTSSCSSCPHTLINNSISSQLKCFPLFCGIPLSSSHNHQHLLWTDHCKRERAVCSETAITEYLIGEWSSSNIHSSPWDISHATSHRILTDGRRKPAFHSQQAPLYTAFRDQPPGIVWPTCCH